MGPWDPMKVHFFDPKTGFKNQFQNQISITISNIDARTNFKSTFPIVELLFCESSSWNTFRSVRGDRSWYARCAGGVIFLASVSVRV